MHTLKLFLIIVGILLISGCRPQSGENTSEYLPIIDNTTNAASSTSPTVPSSKPSQTMPQPTSTPDAVQEPVITDVQAPAQEQLPVGNTVADDVPVVQASTKRLHVPFAPQAPYQVWDDLHKEACEEASMIMAAAYVNGQTSLTPHQVEQQLLSLVKWQEERGYAVDLTAAETKTVLAEYYDIQSLLVTDVTIESIKRALDQDMIVIIPAAGRQLLNQYFQNPGPIYHMLVITGYTDTHFITNDPGTRRGEGFTYPHDQLLAAVHDWSHDLAVDGMTDEEIEQGQKVMLLINPH